jgi:EF hand
MTLATRLPLLVLAALGVTAAAAAQPPGPGPGPGRGPGGPFGLLAMDANADGKLTRAEFDAGQRARFAEIDANKDGTATPEEFKAFHESRREEMSKIRFAAIDTDKNGQLSPAELAAAKEDKPGPDGPRGERRHGKGGREHGKPDGDDRKPISLTEFSAPGAEAFARADANKDGVVTIAELQALKPGKL